MRRLVALLLALAVLVGYTPYAFAEGSGGNAWQTPIPKTLNIDKSDIEKNKDKLFHGEDVIEDKVIREAVNAAYGRIGEDLTLPVTAEMLKHLVVLSPEKCLPHNPGEDFHKSKSLKGIEYATNLEYVSLPYQPIEDLSPLKDLTKIKYLNITGNNNVTNFDFLNNLVNMEELHMRMVKVKDISALAKFKKLTYFDGDSCEISDFSPLGELTNLRFLNLDKNYFQEDSAKHFEKLVNLEFLNLNNKAPNYVKAFFPKKMTSIEPLKNLTKLKEFHATGHDIEDISILKNMKNLNTVYLNNKAIADFSPVAHVKNVNGKQAQIVKREADKFRPELKIVEVPVGTVITADHLKNGIENLPKGATVELHNGLKNADTSKPGETSQQAKVTFSDGSRSFINVKFQVIETKSAPNPLEVSVLKDGIPLAESLTFEVLDGDKVVDTFDYQFMGSITNYDPNKSYTIRLKDNEKYEVVTKYLKIVGNEEIGQYGAHFVKSKDEPVDAENAMMIKIQDKKSEIKNPLEVMVSKDGVPLAEDLTFEVLDGDKVVDTFDYQSYFGTITNYDPNKSYTIHLKDNEKYEIVTKYLKIVGDKENGQYGAHFVQSSEEPVSSENAAFIKLKDVEKTETPDQPAKPQVISALSIQVLYNGKPKEGIRLRINRWDGEIIPSIEAQPDTDQTGTVRLEGLKPNMKYTVVMGSKEYRFDVDTFEIRTDEKGNIKSVDGKNPVQYKDGYTINAYDKSSESKETVGVDLKIIDKKTGKPAEGVEITANRLNPNLSSYRNVTSDANGDVHFELEGTESGKLYAMTVSKNGQFLWEFEPELIEVKVYKDGYAIQSTKDNKEKENIFRVTKNDKTYLKDVLRERIAKGEELLKSEKYTTESKKALETVILGGEEELKKAETIPYYVEGHIENIEQAIKGLVLKETKPEKPEVKPETTPDKPEVKQEANGDRYINLTPVGSGQAAPSKPSKKSINRLAIPNHSTPVTLTDIPAGAEGSAIRYMVARGVLKGMDNGKFEPKTTITRAMVTETFMRISEDKRVLGQADFSDVKSGDWFRRSVAWADGNGLVKGYEDGSFKPNQKVTVEEFAVMMDRLLSEYGVELKKVNDVERDRFNHLPDWSRDAVIRMAESGLISVEKDRKFEPKAEFSRKELAESLHQLAHMAE